MTFTAAIFTKLTVVQVHYMEMLYAKLHLNEPRSMGSVGINSFVECMAVTKLFSTELMSA
jgi:hypothetical protein